MSTIFPFFAECKSIAVQPELLPIFMHTLFASAEVHDTVLMADHHIITCPNFRRALRTAKYALPLKGLIEQGRIQAAMFDGHWTDEGGIKHFTFHEFQRWVINYDLWKSSGPEPCKILGDTTRTELNFFDRALRKTFVAARGRDVAFVKELFANLDNPELRKALEGHHSAFKSIVTEVYGDDRSTGIIFVTPHTYAGDRNVHKKFAAYLETQDVPNQLAKLMLGVVDDFGNAIMAAVVLDMIDAAPSFSPVQSRWQRILGSRRMTILPALPAKKPRKNAAAAKTLG